MKKIYFFAALCGVAMCNTMNGHEYVDLGLPSGTKWATCNVGATSPEEYGDYYTWGETTTKCYYYLWETYKYGDLYDLTKYNTDSGCGTVDNKTTLEAADDAATQNWGGNWRMPTIDEWIELIENCDWPWTDNYKGTGVAGRIVASRTNGNSIFLPAASGCCNTDLYSVRGVIGVYWSSSLSADASYGAQAAVFDSDTVGGGGQHQPLLRAIRSPCMFIVCLEPKRQ